MTGIIIVFAFVVVMLGTLIIYGHFCERTEYKKWNKYDNMSKNDFVAEVKDYENRRT